MTQPQAATAVAAPRPSHVHVDAEGEAHQLAEPSMPELAPGESVTTTPELWCQRCQQPRGGTRCAVCGAKCRNRVPADVMALPPLRDDPEMDAPELDLTALEGTSQLQLEPQEVDRILDEVQRPRSRPAAPPRPASPGLQRLQARAAELTAPEPEPPIVQRAAASRSLVSAAIAEQQVNRPWEPLTGARPQPPYRRRQAPMPPQASQRTYDERGREMQSMQGGARRGQLSAEDQLVQFWAGAKVTPELWCRFAAAFASRPDCVDADGNPDPQRAADLADQLYVELIQRQNLAGQAR